MSDMAEYNCEVWVKTKPLTCQERLPDGRLGFTDDVAIDLTKKRHSVYPNIDYVVRKEHVACKENNWKQSYEIIFDTTIGKEPEQLSDN